MLMTLKSVLIMRADVEVEMLCDGGILMMRYCLIDVIAVAKRMTMSLKKWRVMVAAPAVEVEVAELTYRIVVAMKGRLGGDEMMRSKEPFHKEELTHLNAATLTMIQKVVEGLYPKIPSCRFVFVYSK